MLRCRPSEELLKEANDTLSIFEQLKPIPKFPEMYQERYDALLRKRIERRNKKRVFEIKLSKKRKIQCSSCQCLHYPHCVSAKNTHEPCEECVIEGEHVSKIESDDDDAEAEAEDEENVYDNVEEDYGYGAEDYGKDCDYSDEE